MPPIRESRSGVARPPVADALGRRERLVDALGGDLDIEEMQDVGHGWISGWKLLFVGIHLIGDAAGQARGLCPYLPCLGKTLAS
jgi:hypothetical protein